MSQSQGESQVYGLYAVLVHSGFSCHAGHYFCYIKVLALIQVTVLIYQDAAHVHMHLATALAHAHTFISITLHQQLTLAELNADFLQKP